MIRFNIEDIIEKYRVTVYNIAYHYTKNRQDADDIFQNVCFKLIKKKPEFNDENHERAYVIKTTVNTAKSYVRNLWFKKVCLIERDLSEKTNIEIKEEKELYSALEKLPAKYKIVIHLYYYENMSVKEIGEALNKKESTVKTHLYRARKLLRDYFDEEE